MGNFKNDKKDGFGLYYLLNETYHIGFWEKGKLNGIVKIFIGIEFKYGIWKQGKKEKIFNNENELKKNKEYDLDKSSVLSKITFDFIKIFMNIKDEE